jgi:hypothetical protein
MIGVVANSSDEAAVREFFELFKTSWEFYEPERKYDVILCAEAGNLDLEEDAAKLVLIYSGCRLPLDDTENVQVAKAGNEAHTLLYKGFRIPIYGDHLLFRENTGALPARELPNSPIYCPQLPGRAVVRIGYDLFAEVRTLLSTGQPAVNAAIPTLELHIALLRALIVTNGIPISEIPPVPAGYRFIACLTHDVDHPMIRRHKFDHTMFGFLYRAICGSLVDAFRGRVPWQKVRTNWAAVLKLPLIHLGLAKDCWSEMERYVDLEGGARSSYFVIPFAGRPGRSRTGTAPSARAARYGAADISGQVRNLISAGCEIGLHGIDAWADSSRGSDELEEIRRITGQKEIGVRMHWLYFDEQSPLTLEKAGASYDSTVGYNETIGYRAGTTQAYKHPGTSHLIELPMHLMDTALFFTGYLDLSAEEARIPVRDMIDNAIQFGGCLTVNWHDRSIAPERLWDEFYVDLVADLRARGAWLATAGQAVAWFRKRRSAAFESVGLEAETLRVKIAVEAADDLPGLQLRVSDGHEQRQKTLIAHPRAESSGDPGQKKTVDACVAFPSEMATATETN